MHSQRSLVTAGEAFVQRVHLQPDDRCMIVLPLFHMNALFYSVAGALAAGGSVAIVPKFSASTFWQTAVELGATVANIIEAIGSILQAAPARRVPARPSHPRRLWVRQNFAETFRSAFGIPHLFSGFGMTEIPGVTCNPLEGEQARQHGHDRASSRSGTAVAECRNFSTTRGRMCRRARSANWR